LPVLDVTGAAALRSGDFSRAVAELVADSAIEDSAYHHFKLGLAYHHVGEHGKALRNLREAAKSCSLLAPAAYEFIARTELGQQRHENALAAYRSSLGYPMPQRYQIELQKEIVSVIGEGGMDAAEMQWLGPWYRPPAAVVDTTADEVADSLVRHKDWAALDSLVGLSLRSDERKRTCEFLSRVALDSIPDSVFGTEMLFDAAAILQECGRYETADAWLTRSVERSDFDRQVSKKRAMYLRGMLSYRLKQYEDALKWLRRFERTDGPSPGVVITLARSYRYSGRPQKAAEWYDRHIDLFPRHSQTQAILWYRAWQREESDQLSTAIELYRRLRQHYRYGSRVVDALFREGLLYYRMGAHDSAQQTWQTLMRSYPRSSEVTAAAYWYAKSLLVSGKNSEAVGALQSLIIRDPLSYYSYRAQETLREMGDTTSYILINTTSDIETSRRWLDSMVAIQGTAELEPQDSAAYRTGVMLVVAGLVANADYYLEPLLLRYSSDLALQFEIASLYATCGYPTHSYRAARPLAWRIPSECRSAIPLRILSVLYPRAFISTIETASAHHTVEPNLVSAIIRQESIFDPRIMSPVGAIGLMQLMPYTAKDIAQQLGDEYQVDSLYYPSTNIRYGTYYIGRLIEQFDGNIVLALAGYNGGPHNAKRWYERNKDQEFDLFIENISYTETRGYVKRVLANYWTYQRLSHIDEYTSGAMWSVNQR
jgi:soluble lytic murein transglycosylase-like protein/TolA-binding protein